MLPEIEWEFWLDNNLSPIIAKWLKDETGYTIKSSFILELYLMDDYEIYKVAKESKAKVILISKDTDFPHIINRFGSPPKLINLKIGNTDNKILFNFILKNLKQALNRLLKDDIDIVDIEQ